MDSFRYVGPTATTLEDGRPLEPGEFTGPIDVSEDSPHNQMLFDEGRLLQLDAQATDTSDTIKAREEQEAATKLALATEADAANNKKGTGESS